MIQDLQWLPTPCLILLLDPIKKFTREKKKSNDNNKQFFWADYQQRYLWATCYFRKSEIRLLMKALSCLHKSLCLLMKGPVKLPKFFHVFKTVS